MTQLSTWVQIGTKFTAVCHKGSTVEAQSGVYDKAGTKRLDIGWLAKYANDPTFSFPGQIVFDPDAKSPLPMYQKQAVNVSVAPTTPNAPRPSAPVAKDRLIVKYSYMSQRDNSYKPGSACAPTSLAMACSAYGIATPSSAADDWIYRRLESHYGQRIAGTTDSMRRLMEVEFKFKDEVVWNLTQAQIIKHFQEGGVIVLHTKANTLTRSGHVIFLAGYDLKGEGNGNVPSVVAGDPWGSAHRNSGGKYTPGKGHNVRYSFDWIIKSCLAAHMLSHSTRKVTYE